MKIARYVMIYNQFKQMILDGKYHEHHKLPSKRKLAESMKVSPLTVDAAYQQLIAEGYVYAIEKKGFFVAKTNELVLGKSIIDEEKLEKNHEKTYLFSFETNVVDTKLFPNATWAKLSREAISENHHEMLNYIPAKGLDVLRNEIVNYLALYRGINVSREQVIIGSGSTSLINMIVEILGRNKIYGVEKPGFSRIEQLFIANDVHLTYVPIDQMGLSVLELKNKPISVIHVTPSHQYPTGIVMPISRRIELLNWAMENHTYIIEDDYDSEFRYQGKPIFALRGLDQNDRVIYMNTFSKSLAPSFRMSYMVLPKHLLNRYHTMSTYHGCTVPTFDQYVMYKFMNGGYFERHVNRMRNYYRQKLELIRNYLQTYTWMKFHGDEAGLHFMIEIIGEENEEELKKKIEKASIKISVLVYKKLFMYPCLIIGYSGIPMDEITHYLDALIEAIAPKNNRMIDSDNHISEVR